MQAEAGPPAARLDLTSDPAAAAAGLERYWTAAPEAARAALRHDPGLLRALAALMAGSEFLTEALIQNPDWLLWLEQERRSGTRPAEEWSARLGAFTANLPPGERTRGLIRFKRREYLRIALRDLEGRAGLAETARELSDLADAELQQAYTWAWNDLAGEFGTPQGAGGAVEFVVIGLGKLGGGELNYSSDIDLMFAYSEEGATRGGAHSLSHHEFFTRLAQAITRTVSAVTGEGPAYRVDLRLRPGGREGEMAQPWTHLADYYLRRAREWELQMLLRARGCAGSPRLAARLLQAVAPRMFPAAPDAEALAEGVRGARQAIQQQLRRHRATGRRRSEVDVKLDAGGIRDIEFLTQYLQRLHGGSEPWVRSGHTLQALQRLHDKGWMASRDLQLLSSAYILLRHVEHRLQLRWGQQTHALPVRAAARQALARSLRAVIPGWESEGEAATAAIAARMAEVEEVYQRYLGGNHAQVARAEEAAGGPLPWLPRPLSPHAEHQALRLERSLASWPDAVAAVRGLDATAAGRAVRALESSDWMAEVLIRRPELALALAEGAEPPMPADMAELRLWQQGELLRLLSREWEQRRPVEQSLRELSTLAERILARSLELARAGGSLAPSLAVLGLGRLGLGELDLLSDVDLVFVAGEEDREDAARLAARWIQVLTAYTQTGTLYAVDTRLRPGGREGELVQTPASLARYFREHAGLWEAVSYLKARAVAGDGATAARALAAVQTAVRERFEGQAIGDELRRLRDRMEREGKPGRWGLKTVAGGYYDVDFVLSARLLESGHTGFGPIGLAGWAQAGGGGLLPQAAAAELGGAVRLLRAADHALRVGTGKAGAAVPGAGASLERGWSWLAHSGAVESAAAAAGAVEEARRRIREIYQTLL
jgi:glutamate-ammonia-ligase adenylyltransferase